MLIFFRIKLLSLQVHAPSHVKKHWSSSEAMQSCRKHGEKKLGAVRKNSALDLLLDELVGMPVFTIKLAGETIRWSADAVTLAIERCIDADIIKAIDGKKRNKVYEVPDVISEFNLLECKPASPVGDTERAKPVRLVPVRMMLFSAVYRYAHCSDLGSISSCSWALWQSNWTQLLSVLWDD